MARIPNAREVITRRTADTAVEVETQIDRIYYTMITFDHELRRAEAEALGEAVEKLNDASRLLQGVVEAVAARNQALADLGIGV